MTVTNYPDPSVTQLNVKFRKAIPTTEPVLTIRAKVAKQVRNLVYISAEIKYSSIETDDVPWKDVPATLRLQNAIPPTQEPHS